VAGSEFFDLFSEGAVYSFNKPILLFVRVYARVLLPHSIYGRLIRHNRAIHLTGTSTT
jgi:hypothetical protein